MKNIVLFLFLGCLFTCFGQESAFKSGNEAYATGDYETALSEYNKIVGTEQMSTSLYYNLGNTYYQLGEIGEAIWAYDRALKLNPGNENVQKNLAIANAQTVDHLDRSEAGIGNWLAITFFNFPINFWAVVSILISIVLSIFIYLFLTTKNQKTKNISLSGNVIGIALLLLTVFISARHKSTIIKRENAIIISEFVDVKASPSTTSPTSFQIYEGTKVDLMRSSDNWVEVSVNDNTGWVEKSSLWEI